MEDQRGPNRLAPLREAAVLKEHEFTSSVPIVGGLIAAFRRRWNNVSTRWYISPVMRQQSAFNQLTIEQLTQLMAELDGQAEQLTALRGEIMAQLTVLRDEMAAQSTALRGEMATEIAGLAAKLDHVQEWLIDQDRGQTELRHDLGEVELLVRQLLHSLPGAAPNSKQLDQSQPTDAPV